MSTTSWLAVDWGTSNVRAWGIDSGGAVVFERSLARGMSRLSSSDYYSVLDQLVQHDINGRSEVDVMICGMAGARQGWLEARYVALPADLGSLHMSTVSPPPDGGNRYRVRILPGLMRRHPDDVMRGEETQLLGLMALRPGFSGSVLLPGTHSKWATVAGGQIEDFSTSMTGELFELLRFHSVLRLSASSADSPSPTSDGFLVGLNHSLSAPELLLTHLFQARAAALLSDRSPQWCSDYISGLLIGCEVASFRSWHSPTGILPIVGAPRLASLYHAALSCIDIAAEIISATTTTIAGLTAARARLE